MQAISESLSWKIIKMADSNIEPCIHSILKAQKFRDKMLKRLARYTKDELKTWDYTSVSEEVFPSLGETKVDCEYIDDKSQKVN